MVVVVWWVLGEEGTRRAGRVEGFPLIMESLATHSSLTL